MIASFCGHAVAVGIQEATGFFGLMLLKRKRVLSDWPSLDHSLIPDPALAEGGGIRGLAKTVTVHTSKRE